MSYKGACHCGRVAFEVQGDFAEVVECNCSHCIRKGYLLWFVPREQLGFQSGEADLVTYTFNKHVIRHQFCPSCGCAPLVRIGRARALLPSTCVVWKAWIWPA